MNKNFEEFKLGNWYINIETLKPLRLARTFMEKVGFSLTLKNLFFKNVDDFEVQYNCEEVNRFDWYEIECPETTLIDGDEILTCKSSPDSYVELVQSGKYYILKRKDVKKERSDVFKEIFNKEFENISENLCNNSRLAPVIPDHLLSIYDRIFHSSNLTKSDALDLSIYDDDYYVPKK